MILVVLLLVAVLIVMVMVLAAVTTPKLPMSPYGETSGAKDQIDRIQRQTIDAMFSAARDSDVIDAQEHDI